MIQNRRLRSLVVATALISTLLSSHMVKASSYCPEAEEIAKDACYAASRAATQVAGAIYEAAVALENVYWDNLPPEQQTEEAAFAHQNFLTSLLIALAQALQAILAALQACLAAANLIC